MCTADPALDPLWWKDEKAAEAEPSSPRRTADPLSSSDMERPEQKVTKSRAMLMGISTWPPCAALWQYRAALRDALLQPMQFPGCGAAVSWVGAETCLDKLFASVLLGRPRGMAFPLQLHGVTALVKATCHRTSSARSCWSSHLFTKLPK